jgi:Type IV secretory system Conjugative DNA transfer
MLSLPRGAFKGAHNVKLSTAEWVRPSTIARLAYEGGGALFLGAAPYEEVWPKLLDLQANVAALQTDIEARAQTQHQTPITRAHDLRELEAIWLRGMLADCMPLGLSDDRHFVTIPGARSGKGQSAIIPNLCLYPGSVVCLDPKGENASLTAARRGQGDALSQGLGQEGWVGAANA